LRPVLVGVRVTLDARAVVHGRCQATLHNMRK
jgi:hypothetical protein